MSKPIAIQVYSVRDDAAADFYGTLKKIKEIGYDGFLTIEREAGATRFQDIKNAVSFLTDILNKLY